MKFQAADNCKKLTGIVENYYKQNKTFDQVTAGCTLEVGMAKDGFGVPSHAVDGIFVGDEDHIGERQSNAMTDALFKADPNRVIVRPKWNSGSRKWDITMSPLGDAFDPIAGQLFSPWNASYFSRIYKEPLSYTNVDKYIHYDSGTDPWCEIMNLAMEKYSGWALTGATGDLQNQLTSDVNVRDGMMSANVINISGTYSLTLEEQSKAGHNPHAESGIIRKQQYLSYVMRMIQAYIALYGNEETDTAGLFNVNPVRIWSSPSLKDIFEDTTIVAKGSYTYQLLALLVNEFLTAADNKYNHIVIVLSPQAYNYLQSMPYSDVYDPTSAMQIFAKNYCAGKGKDGSTPTIEFIVEPMLKANSIFNPLSSDFMLLLAPTMPAGTQFEEQPNYVFGAPLRKYIFPVVPGTYNTQYKTLSRTAGIFAPVPAAIRVYQGFGVD